MGNLTEKVKEKKYNEQNKGKKSKGRKSVFTNVVQSAMPTSNHSNISTSVPSFIRSIAPSNLPSRITSNNATSLASDKKNTITKSTTLSGTYKSEKNNLDLTE